MYEVEVGKNDVRCPSTVAAELHFLAKQILVVRAIFVLMVAETASQLRLFAIEGHGHRQQVFQYGTRLFACVLEPDGIFRFTVFVAIAGVHLDLDIFIQSEGQSGCFSILGLLDIFTCKVEFAEAIIVLSIVREGDGEIPW